MDTGKIIEIEFYNLLFAGQIFRRVYHGFSARSFPESDFAGGNEFAHRQSMIGQAVVDNYRQAVFAFEIFKRQIYGKVPVETFAYFYSVQVNFAFVADRADPKPVRNLFVCRQRKFSFVKNFTDIVRLVAIGQNVVHTRGYSHRRYVKRFFARNKIVRNEFIIPYAV